MQVSKKLEMSRKKAPASRRHSYHSLESLFCYPTSSPGDTAPSGLLSARPPGAPSVPITCPQRVLVSLNFPKEREITHKSAKKQALTPGRLEYSSSPTDQGRIQYPHPSTLPDRSHKSLLFCLAYRHRDKFISHLGSNLSGDLAKPRQVHTEGEAKSQGMQAIAYLWTYLVPVQSLPRAFPEELHKK